MRKDFKQNSNSKIYMDEGKGSVFQKNREVTLSPQKGEVIMRD